MTVDTPGIRFSVMIWIHSTVPILVALMMHGTGHNLSLATFYIWILPLKTKFMVLTFHPTIHIAHLVSSGHIHTDNFAI